MPTQNKIAVLVINSGSSSVKFTLYQMPEETILASGAVERIGLEGPQIGLSEQPGSENPSPTEHSGDNVQEAVAELVES